MNVASENIIVAVWQDKKVWNVPNFLTLTRMIILTPLILYLLINKYFYHAGVIFVIAAITDQLDGYIARKWNQVTKLGERLDPISDKILILSPLIVLSQAGVLWWIIMIIFLREILISLGRFYLDYCKNLSNEVQVSYLGKIKMWAQSIAIIYAILQLPYFNFIMFIAMVITVVSGVDYFFKFFKVLVKK